ncbi:MAG: glycerophosphodiester phosphodiesterase [Propionibacteriaceae bacterium]|nr:glycerophosphodiester phosphodiesterase [Propionibacteriaceae bacterium]
MTEIWAHRGASAYAPENTIPAFKLALDQGAQGIELDLQRSADGVLVVVHDETINRTSSGFGRVMDLTFDELRRCDFSNGFIGHRNVRIPTLTEVLDLIRPTNAMLNVELKNSVVAYPDLELEAAAMVADAGMSDRVLFSSFNHASLANLRDVVPPSKIGVLYSDGLYNPWQYARWIGAGALHPNWHALWQPDYVWLAHEAGVKVNVWTVDEEKDVARALEMGVDALVTNFPDRAKRVVRLGR